MTAIRSRKYIDGSKGQSCLFQIPGVCTGGGDTTVFAHIRDVHTGKSVKASDLSGGDCCFACHEVFDRRAKLPDGKYLSDFDWLFYGLRAMQGTIERRVAQGLLFVSQDVVTRFAERPTKPRKPPEQRAKVGPSRPLQSANRWPEPGTRKIASRKLANISNAQRLEGK